MNLVTRFLAARRDKLLMRLGCWLVCFSLVLGLMLPQQKAEALVAELSMTAVAGVAASYLCACGLPLVTQGMDRDALVSNVQRLIQEFLDTELGGITIQDWLGNVWDLAVIAGKLIMGRPLTDEFVGFAQWVVGKYAAQVGENVVYSGPSFYLSDGTLIVLGLVTGSGPFDISVPSNLTIFSINVLYEFDFGGTFGIFREDGTFFFRSDSPNFSAPNEYKLSHSDVVSGLSSFGTYCLGYYSDSSGVSLRPFVRTVSGYYTIWYQLPWSYFPDLAVSDLLIDRAPSMSYIPEGIAAEQGIALDVGAAATMDLDLVLQGVLDDVLAGELTSTMEVAGEEVVDPPAEEIPDVDDLGLHALGQALTSRFPFSIPWDFFRAVQLLAAPAKAPYFEVDFMEPLADDVGGWQGDTTVVLDFSEYAIIGQISRWTSTIGFCLMLAGATKRLIWTA